MLLSSKYEEIYKKKAFVKKMPKFIEKFIINEGSLNVFTEFLPMNEEISEGFAYGYHPYIQFDDIEINGHI